MMNNIFKILFCGFFCLFLVQAQAQEKRDLKVKKPAKTAKNLEKMDLKSAIVGTWASEKVNDQPSNPEKPTLMIFNADGKGEIKGSMDLPLQNWTLSEDQKTLSWQVEDAPVVMEYEVTSFEGGRLVLMHTKFQKETILVKR